MESNKTQQLAAASATDGIVLANLPDLSKAEVAPTELLGEYWTPTEVGETKRVFFAGFGTQSVIEQATGEERDLDIVMFIERQADGSFRTIRNGSARLVGVFTQFAANIRAGQPFEITYQGKKKTNTGKFADSWSVKPLLVG